MESETTARRFDLIQIVLGAESLEQVRKLLAEEKFTAIFHRTADVAQLVEQLIRNTAVR